MPSAASSRRWEGRKRINKSAYKAISGEHGGEERSQEDLALWCQSRMTEGGIVPPHSVLAPGTALRSVPTVALPSAQVTGIVSNPKELSNWTNQKGKERSQASARLFDRSCPRAT